MLSRKQRIPAPHLTVITPLGAPLKDPFHLLDRLGQALDRLVLPSSMHHCTYTRSLSTT